MEGKVYKMQVYKWHPTVGLVDALQRALKDAPVQHDPVYGWVKQVLLSAEQIEYRIDYLENPDER